MHPSDTPSGQADSSAARSSDLRRAAFEAPFGRIELAWCGTQVVRVVLGAPAPDAALTGAQPAPLPDWLAQALRGYFADPTQRSGCAVAAQGSAFQRRAWARIAAIAPGETRTYGAIARELQSAPRAVGNACRANPVPLFVPCHRVVGAGGLGGFAGERGGRLLAIKRWLLRHEGVLPAAPEDPA